jgi:hypothetical protein
MDIRTVETLPMSGVLSDPFYKLDGTKESVSLDWSYVNNSFDLIDRNIDYSRLPLAPDTFAKKVFLTYNGISCQTKELLETVVMESSSAASLTFLPGYRNSNEWAYQPANFRVPAEVENGSSVDLLSWPYPYNEGVTLIKTFLNNESNVVLPLYTAYYRRPTMSVFELANVEGSKVFTDGWYTSYVIIVKTAEANSADPTQPLSCAEGLIVFDTDEQFYVNITGTCLPPGVTFTPGPGPIYDLALPRLDPINWSPVISFAQWQTFLKSNYVNSFGGAGGANYNNEFTGTLAPNILSGYSATLNQSTNSGNSVGLVGNPSPANTVTGLDPVFYVESNHLATPMLNLAILCELKKLCGCCKEDKFGMSHIEMWVKLRGKREAAFIYFNEESFKAAQEMIISSRSNCHISLTGETCDFNFGTQC